MLIVYHLEMSCLISFWPWVFTGCRPCHMAYINNETYNSWTIETLQNYQWKEFPTRYQKLTWGFASQHVAAPSPRQRKNRERVRVRIRVRLPRSIFPLGEGVATHRVGLCRNSVSDLFLQCLQTAKRGKQLKSQIKCKLSTGNPWLSVVWSKFEKNCERLMNPGVISLSRWSMITYFWEKFLTNTIGNQLVLAHQQLWHYQRTTRKQSS